MVFNAKIAHRGQYKRYGDYFRVWEIESDMPKESVIEKCFSELHKTKLPEEKEWRKGSNKGIILRGHLAGTWTDGIGCLHGVGKKYTFITRSVTP